MNATSRDFILTFSTNEWLLEDVHRLTDGRLDKLQIVHDRLDRAMRESTCWYSRPILWFYRRTKRFWMPDRAYAERVQSCSHSSACLDWVSLCGDKGVRQRDSELNRLLVFGSTAPSSMKKEILSPLSRKYRLFDCSLLSLVENTQELSTSGFHCSINCLTDCRSSSHCSTVMNCLTTRYPSASY